MIAVLLGIGGFIALIAGLYFLMPEYAPLLAENNLFFTKNIEGRGQIITMNDGYYRAIMSFKDRYFYHGPPRIVTDIPPGETEVKEFQVDEGDILPGGNEPGDFDGWWFLENRMQGIFWIGNPLKKETYRHVQRWMGFDYLVDEKGKMGTERVPIPHVESMTHILLSDEFYYVPIAAAETLGSPIAVDIGFSVVACIENMYKSHFGVQDWFEALTTLVSIATREFTSMRTPEQMMSLASKGEATKDEIAKKEEDDLIKRNRKELENVVKSRFGDIREKYGLHIKDMGIVTIGPSSPDFLKLILLLETATREGNANVKAAELYKKAKAFYADAERNFNEQAYGSLPKDPNQIRGVAAMRLSDPKSPIKTWVEGGGAAIAVSTSSDDDDKPKEKATQTEGGKDNKMPEPALPTPLNQPKEGKKSGSRSQRWRQRSKNKDN